MKIALCLSGQPRFLEKAFPYINNHLIVPNKPDVFFHTWFDKDDVGKEYRGDNSQWKTNPNNKVNPNTIDLLMSLYKPTAYKIEKQKELKNSKWNMMPTTEAVMRHYSNPEGRNYLINSMYCMWYSIFEANHVKEVYRMENDIHYDCVIRCRFDAIIPRVLVCSELDLSILWVSHDRQVPNTVDDWFAVSSNRNMNIYTGMFPLMDIYHEQCMARDGISSNEHLAYEMVKHFDLEWRVLPNFKIEFVRPWMV